MESIHEKHRVWFGIDDSELKYGIAWDEYGRLK
jgi:hypothetical protein